MDFLGVPWFIAVRHLGPPLAVLAVGAVLILRGRPPRAGLLWAALATHLAAAALPFLWRWLQVATGYLGETHIGLVMTLLQPGVESAAWVLVLWAVLAQRPRAPRGHRPEGPGREGAPRSARPADGPASRAPRSR